MPARRASRCPVPCTEWQRPTICNDVVRAAQLPMMAAVYALMFVVCGLTFRSMAATLCIIIPLAIVSLFANATMAMLGIGLKISTLPVAALGVGIEAAPAAGKLLNLDRHFEVVGKNLFQGLGRARTLAEQPAVINHQVVGNRLTIAQALVTQSQQAEKVS